jgi:hypothetical protein
MQMVDPEFNSNRSTNVEMAGRYSFTLLRHVCLQLRLFLETHA